MPVEAYDPAHRAEWDEFVLSHPTSGMGHLSGVIALERATSAAAVHSLVARGDDGRVAGVLPLFELRRSELRIVPMKELVTGTHFPSGPLIDHAMGEKQRNRILDAFMSATAQLAEQRRVDRVSVSLPALQGDRRSIDVFGYYPLRKYGYRETNGVGLLIDLRRDVDALQSGLKSGCRGAIRKCEREGGSFRVVTERSEWLACHPLAVQTLGEDAPSVEAMGVVWDEFVAAGHALIGLVERDGHVASVAVAACRNASCYYWFGFNARPQLVAGANNLALWRLMLLCRERGYALFETGSLEFSGGKQAGISAFKESFGGEPFYGMAGVLERRRMKAAAIEFLALGIGSLRRRANRPKTESQ
jgi:hypothetical protein